MALTYRELKQTKFLDATRNFAESDLGIRFQKGDRAFCPFHDDAQDSFRIYVNGGEQVRFHCFGACDGDWDVYDIIMMNNNSI